MEHVYLTENTPDNAAAVRKQAALQRFIEEGFVTYSIDPEPQAQMRVYQTCLENYRTGHNWMAFFDMDEFLVIREKCAQSPTSHPITRRLRGAPEFVKLANGMPGCQFRTLECAPMPAFTIPAALQRQVAERVPRPV